MRRIQRYMLAGLGLFLGSVIAAGCHTKGEVGFEGDPDAPCRHSSPGNNFEVMDHACSMQSLWEQNKQMYVDCEANNCFNITENCISAMEWAFGQVLDELPPSNVSLAFYQGMQKLMYAPMARADSSDDPFLPFGTTGYDDSTVCYDMKRGSGNHLLGLWNDIHPITDPQNIVMEGCPGSVTTPMSPTSCNPSHRNEQHYQFIFERLEGLKVKYDGDGPLAAITHYRLKLGPVFEDPEVSPLFHASILMHEMIHKLKSDGDVFQEHHYGTSGNGMPACPIPGTDQCDQSAWSPYGVGAMTLHTLALGHLRFVGHTEPLTMCYSTTGGEFNLDLCPAGVTLYPFPMMEGHVPAILGYYPPTDVQVRSVCLDDARAGIRHACTEALRTVVDAFENVPPGYSCHAERDALVTATNISGVVEPPCLAEESAIEFRCGDDAEPSSGGVVHSAVTGITSLPPALHDQLLEEPLSLLDDDAFPGVSVTKTMNAAGGDVFTFDTVSAGSLAANAGIQANDVLTHVNGAAVTSSSLAQYAAAPGRVESLTLSRPGVTGPQSITIELAASGGGCATGVSEQSFTTSMVGCAGSVTWGSREDLCNTGWHACTAAEYVDRNFSSGVTTNTPSHHYWTDDDLKYSGTSSSCSVSTSSGTTCSSPMRVCAPASTGQDPLGNMCNWRNCGHDGSTANNFFGGCAGNTTAGTLCCK